MPLVAWERLIALVSGAASIVFGTLAIFKTESEAGPAVLVLVGAALLLVGIQATPLIKLGGDKASIELGRRRAAAQRAVDEAVAESPPEVAQSVIQAVAAVEPTVQRYAALASARLLYESSVSSALMRLGYSVDRVGADRSVDRLVARAGDRTVRVVVKHLTNPEIAARRIRDLRAQFLSGAFTSPTAPTLIVVSVLPASSARALADQDLEHLFTQWQDERDDGSLQAALEKAWRHFTQSSTESV